MTSESARPVIKKNVASVARSLEGVCTSHRPHVTITGGGFYLPVLDTSKIFPPTVTAHAQVRNKLYMSRCDKPFHVVLVSSWDTFRRY